MHGATESALHRALIKGCAHVFHSMLFEAATRSDTAWEPCGVPRTTHELVWSEKTAPQKTVPGWSRAHYVQHRWAEHIQPPGGDNPTSRSDSKALIIVPAFRFISA